MAIVRNSSNIDVKLLNGLHAIHIARCRYGDNVRVLVEYLVCDGAVVLALSVPISQWVSQSGAAFTRCILKNDEVLLFPNALDYYCICTFQGLLLAQCIGQYQSRYIIAYLWNLSLMRSLMVSLFPLAGSTPYFLRKGTIASRSYTTPSRLQTSSTETMSTFTTLTYHS